MTSALAYLYNLENPRIDTENATSSLQNLLQSLYQTDVRYFYPCEHVERITKNIMYSFGGVGDADVHNFKDSQNNDRRYDVGIFHSKKGQLLNDILEHLSLLHPDSIIVTRIAHLLTFIYTEYADYKKGISQANFLEKEPYEIFEPEPFIRCLNLGEILQLCQNNFFEGVQKLFHLLQEIPCYSLSYSFVSLPPTSMTYSGKLLLEDEGPNESTYFYSFDTVSFESHSILKKMKLHFDNYDLPKDYTIHLYYYNTGLAQFDVECPQGHAKELEISFPTEQVHAEPLLWVEVIIKNPEHLHYTLSDITLFESLSDEKNTNSVLHELFDVLYNGLLIKPVNETHHSTIDAYLNLIVATGSVTHLLRFLMNMNDFQLNENHFKKLKRILLMILTASFDKSTVTHYTTLQSADTINYIPQLLDAIQSIPSNTKEWSVVDFHPQYLSTILTFIQKVIQLPMSVEENYKMLISLYNILAKEIDFLFKYDLSLSPFNYSTEFEQLLLVINETVQKYHQWSQEKEQSEHIVALCNELPLPIILSKYCSNILNSEPGMKLEMLINASQYQNNLSFQIVEQFSPLLTKPQMMSRFENNIFSPKIQSLYFSTLSNISDTISPTHTEFHSQSLILYILESAVFQTVHCLSNADHKKESYSIAKTKFKDTIELLHSLILYCNNYIVKAKEASCVDNDYYLLFQLLPADLFLLLFLFITVPDQFVYPLVVAVISDLMILRNLISELIADFPSTQKECLYDYLSYTCGYAASLFTRSLTVSYQEQDASMWLNSSLFSSGLTHSIPVLSDIPSFHYDLIGNTPHIIKNNNIDYPEFVPDSTINLQYIRYNQYILLFINHYTAKYDIEIFSQLIHASPLTQLELSGLTITDHTFFLQTCPKIQSGEILQQLLSAFDQNLYMISIPIVDPTLLSIFNTKKLDLASEKLFSTCMTIPDISLSFIMSLCKSINPGVIQALGQRDSEFAVSIISSLCALSYLNNNSVDFYRMFLIYTENPDNVFDLSQIKATIISLSTIIQHLRVMRQFYKKDDQTITASSPNPHLDGRHNRLDFRLPQSFDDYIEQLNGRCELIRHLELQGLTNSNPTKADDESNTRIQTAISYICNGYMVNKDLMIKLLYRREVRGKFRIVGLRLFEQLLSKSLTISTLLYRFLFSLAGQEEGTVNNPHDNITAYHHFNKAIKGCSMLTYFTLPLQYLNFLVAFKRTILVCHSKQFYGDILGIKELTLDYTQSDSWILEQSQICDLFPQLLHFSNGFLVTHPEITNPIHLNQFFRSLHDGVANHSFSKAEIIYELMNMIPDEQFWKSHGIEPNLPLHNYVQYLSEDTIFILAYHAFSTLKVPNGSSVTDGNVQRYYSATAPPVADNSDPRLFRPLRNMPTEIQQLYQRLNLRGAARGRSYRLPHMPHIIAGMEGLPFDPPGMEYNDSDHDDEGNENVGDQHEDGEMQMETSEDENENENENDNEEGRIPESENDEDHDDTGYLGNAFAPPEDDSDLLMNMPALFYQFENDSPIALPSNSTTQTRALLVNSKTPTSTNHRIQHDDVLSTCKIETTCNYVVLAMISAISHDGEIKQRSYEKTFEKAFETLFANNTIEDIPRFSSIKFQASTLTLPKSPQFLISAYSYIRHRLEFYNHFYSQYSPMPYSEDRQQLEGLINTHRDENKFLIDLNLFNIDESIITRTVSVLLTHFSHLSRRTSFCEWMKQEENYLLLIELYNKTTIPNQINILTCVQYGLSNISSETSILSQMQDFILRTLSDLGHILLYSTSIIQTTKDYLSYCSENQWHCIFCRADNLPGTNECNQCHIPYISSGMIWPSHDQSVFSNKNYNGQNLSWKMNKIIELFQSLMKNKFWSQQIFNITHSYVETLSSNIQHNIFTFSNDICVGTALLKIHGGFTDTVSKGSHINVTTKNTVTSSTILEMKSVDHELRVDLPSSSDCFTVNYNSIASMSNPTISLAETPFSGLLTELIQYVYTHYLSLLSKESELPVTAHVIFSLLFNYTQYEILHCYSTLPPTFISSILPSILDISLSISNIPLSLSPLQLSHLLTFNTHLFFDVTYSNVTQHIFPPVKKVVPKSYNNDQQLLIQNLMMLGADQESAIFALEAGQWNADMAANLFFSGDIKQMLQERHSKGQSAATNSGIVATLSENCMVPAALARKALELRDNPNDAAMWLLENKSHYTNLLNQLFTGPITKSVFSNQQVDFNSLFEVNETRNESGTESDYTLSPYTGKEELNVGQIVYINIYGLRKQHKGVQAVYLFQHNPLSYFGIVLQNQYTIITLAENSLKRDVYFLKDRYGYHISEPQDIMNYVSSLSMILAKMVNRSLLSSLMVINRTMYQITDPYTFLQYYKRLGNGYSLDTQYATSLLVPHDKPNNRTVTDEPFIQLFDIYNQLLLENSDSSQFEVDQALKEATFLPSGRTPEELEGCRAMIQSLCESGLSNEEAQQACDLSLPPSTPESTISPCERSNHILKSINSLTISDTLWNLRQSTAITDPQKYEVIESLHPAYRKSDYLGKVTIPSCKAIRIFFDEKCNIGGGRLVFASDEKLKNTINVTTHTHYSSFLVHNNTVYYRFQYDNDSDCWGYRFFVIGLSGVEWTCETDIVSSPSLEWSLWTLNILLCQPNLLNILHHDIKLEIYNALIDYLKTPAPFKSRIIHILTLLFRNPKFFDTIPAIQPIESLAEQAYIAINTHDRQTNNLLRTIIELYCVARYKVVSVNEILLDNSIPENVEIILSFYSILQHYHTTHSLPESLLKTAIIVDSFTGVYESSHPPTNQQVNFSYNNPNCEYFRIIVDPRTTLAEHSTLKFYLGKKEDGKVIDFVRRRNHHYQYEYMVEKCHEISIEFTPGDQSPDQFGFALSIIPIDIKVTASLINEVPKERFSVLPELLQSIQNPRTLHYLMSMFTEFKELYPNYTDVESVFALRGLYDTYVQNYGTVDLPSWDTFRCLCVVTFLFGTTVSAVLKYIDLTQINIPESYANLVQENKQLIHPKIKNNYLCKHLSELKPPNMPLRHQYINVDRNLANRSQERGLNTAIESQCVFRQIYDVLYTSGESIWCVAHDEDYVYKVSFTGESAIDAGGPFRESLHQMVEDLFSDHFDLFVPSSNNKHKHGVDSDGYVPNSKYTELNYLNMYEFVGRVMGYSIRAHALLPFIFPKFIWNYLSGTQLTADDIQTIDLHLHQNLEAIKNATNENELPKQQAFVLSNEKGEIVNLCHQSSESLTMENREQHYQLVVNHILHRYDIQLNAILNGLYSVVPNTLLFLLNGGELEVCVSGKPEVDIDYFKSHTMYSGYSTTDQVIVNFWKLMTSFTHEERRKFIRFAWGRSRLPLKGTRWTNEFQIIRAPVEEIDFIPIAHTCFFQIELPNYPTYELLENKIRLAITYGLGAMMLA